MKNEFQEEEDGGREPWFAAITVAHEKDDGVLNRKGGKGNRNGKIGDIQWRQIQQDFLIAEYQKEGIG